MTPLATAKLALALIGAITFAYGVRVDDERLRLWGIIALVLGVVLRVLRPGRKDVGGDETAGDGDPH